MKCVSQVLVSLIIFLAQCVLLNQVLMFLGSEVRVRQARRICLSSSSHNFAM